MKRLFLFCFLLTLSLAVSAQNKVPAIELKKLPGTWVSIDDKKYQIVFTDSTQTDFYENEKQAFLKYRVTTDQLTTTDQESGEIYKYTILSLSDKYLTLQHHPRGNLLKFSRE
jgi:hypothetical protein